MDLVMKWANIALFLVAAVMFVAATVQESAHHMILWGVLLIVNQISIVQSQLE